MFIVTKPSWIIEKVAHQNNTTKNNFPPTHSSLSIVNYA